MQIKNIFSALIVVGAGSLAFPAFAADTAPARAADRTGTPASTPTTLPANARAKAVEPAASEPSARKGGLPDASEGTKSDAKGPADISSREGTEEMKKGAKTK